MAPSSRNKTSKWQVQPAMKPSVFRVTKSAKLNERPKASKEKLQAIEEIISPVGKPCLTKNNRKRRHDELGSDCENEEAAKRPQNSLRKARSTALASEPLNVSRTRQVRQLETPPPSSPEDESLPNALDELCSLHKSFTQALAVHYAHNGSRTAVSLADLIPAMTRLWKRRSVCQQDIQRMLAVWEINPRDGLAGDEIECKKGPFYLLVTGIGANSHVKLEHAWQAQQTFVESELHQKFERLIEQLHEFAKDHQDSFLLGSVDSFPLLKHQIGAQTQARKEKISLIREEILHKSTQKIPSTASQSLDLSTLEISDANEPKSSSRETALKSRTLSLFDRLRAKQLANSTSASPPTSGELVRRRALHRMPEIIDVLRLKQARKLSSQFRPDIHGSPSKSFATMMKVSFSLDTLVQEIKDSGKTNIADDEIKECISILGRELPDTWCSVYSSGQVKCVTLQGEGWRKEEVRDWCEREISKIGSK